MEAVKVKVEGEAEGGNQTSNMLAGLNVTCAANTINDSIPVDGR